MIIVKLGMNEVPPIITKGCGGVEVVVLVGSWDWWGHWGARGPLATIPHAVRLHPRLTAAFPSDWPNAESANFFLEALTGAPYEPLEMGSSPGRMRHMQPKACPKRPRNEPLSYSKSNPIHSCILNMILKSPIPSSSQLICTPRYPSFLIRGGCHP